MKKFFSFLSGASMGALVGATFALLLAPSSGDDLRSELRGRISTLQNELGQAASSRKLELEKKLAELRQPQPPAA
jgi:gas vesicle protein